MKRSFLCLAGWAALGCRMGGQLLGAAEAFETTAASVAALPAGDEADGIVGDFVLRSGRVIAVICGQQPGRKANWGTFEQASSAGCLIDLALRPGPGDQLTVFSPCRQEGAVEFVRTASSTPGSAAVEVRSESGGIERWLEYRLNDEDEGLWVTSRLRNNSVATQEVSLVDRWTSFPQTGELAGIRWADAPDPARKVGYAVVLTAAARESVQLRPGEVVELRRFLAVGTSPAQAWGKAAAQREPTGQGNILVRDTKGIGVPDATVYVRRGAAAVPLYPDEAGRAECRLIPGTYTLEVVAPGRLGKSAELHVEARRTETREFVLEDAARARFDIRDESGRSLPCKVQFLARSGTPTPDLGSTSRAHGCRDQYFSETGLFAVPLAPGRYGAVVTRGPEYGRLLQPVSLAPGQEVWVRGTLKRVVDTRGWISADFHSHSTPSGDNHCGTDDRLISLAAEHVEFAPATEHNRLTDWAPRLQRLGLAEWLQCVPGVELTGPGAHLNAFPLAPEPGRQDAGAPGWTADPAVSARALRQFLPAEPDRWVQLNHPDPVRDFLDRDGDGTLDGGLPGLAGAVDGVEIQGGWYAGILEGAPIRIARDSRGGELVAPVPEFRWLQLLNQGVRVPVLTGSDAHAVHGDGVGGWRTYLPVATEALADLDWREVAREAKRGHMVLTSGPFLEVTGPQGARPGDTVCAESPVTLRVRVQCADWIDVDRVQVLVNGRARPEFNFTRRQHPECFPPGVVRFERAVEIPLKSDSHLIVVALGEGSDLAAGFGSSGQAVLRPCAYHNPIFVDLDGGGFTPNGDRLDWPLVLPSLTVAEARAKLAHTPPSELLP